MANWVLKIVIICAFAAAGCSKSDSSSANWPAEVQTVDASKLRSAFWSATPEIQSSVNKVMTSIQSSDPTGALMELEKVTTSPNLSEEQKKVVNDLTEQLKKRIGVVAPSPAR